MALDEFCLENIVSDEPYFYLWRNRPSVIIGLNQNAYSEVNLRYLEDHRINLVRRVTGGGAVYHDLQNLNYTIIGPAGLTPQPMVDALLRLGAPAELTGRNDIFVEGRKVSGYARRVSKEQEIIHGTLMYDVDLETLTKVLDTPGSKMQAKGIGSVRSRVANLKDYLPGFKSLDEVQAALQEILSDGDGQMELSEYQLSEVQKMASEKFSTWDFIYGRSRQTDLQGQASLRHRRSRGQSGPWFDQHHQLYRRLPVRQSSRGTCCQTHRMPFRARRNRLRPRRNRRRHLFPGHLCRRHIEINNQLITIAL